MIRWWPGGEQHEKSLENPTVLKMDVKKMQNSHLEFNTLSCLWKGVGLLPYLNHQYDFIPETSRPCILPKLESSSFHPTPSTALHVIIAPSARTHMVALFNLLLGSIFNGISFQRSYRIQKTQRPIRRFDVWNAIVFWWRCSRRSWANAASEIFFSKWVFEKNCPFWHLKRVKHISPTNIPRILHFNCGSPAVPTWKLLVFRWLSCDLPVSFDNPLPWP